MSPHLRDLRNAGLYIAALVALGVGMTLGGISVAERVAASSVIHGVAAALDEGENARPRMSLLVEHAREIRAALAKPTPPRAPLPPITAKLAYGHLKNSKHAVAVTAIKKVPNLSKAARNAMASAEVGPPTGSSPLSVDKHRVY